MVIQKWGCASAIDGGRYGVFGQRERAACLKNDISLVACWSNFLCEERLEAGDCEGTN